MLDFLSISAERNKRGVIEVSPRFIAKKSSDLMIRGKSFYAIWNDAAKMWTTDWFTALEIIDKELDLWAEEYRKKKSDDLRILYMRNTENGMLAKFKRYCEEYMDDNYHQLNSKLIFSNDSPKKNDYASITLPYPLKEGDISAYEKLMSVLYKDEERRKIEWAIGSVVSGDSKKIQKFIVLYGSAGTGKSTVLNIIEKLFQGYWAPFDARSIGASGKDFSLAPFKNNPLVAIQHDGDLSHIEDNAKLNSLVSHETMIINEKFKAPYNIKASTFLFMGTNRPVKITDAKSGLLRRLIDVTPSGDIIPPAEYEALTSRIPFELGAIAYHCLQIYEDNPGAYNRYVPTLMLGASNDFYNFVSEYYVQFKNEDQTSLKSAWEMYKTYVNEARVQYPMSQRSFKEELRNYFNEYYDRYTTEDGSRVRSVYIGFKDDKFETVDSGKARARKGSKLIEFKKIGSIFDKVYGDCYAQYATVDGVPSKKWSYVNTKLSELDTSKLHYVKVPENLIVIDFDIKGKDGNKSFEKNIEEASKWPQTYAELSKSGAGIHLHYIYDGDISKLSRVYDNDIEIKVFTGNSSLRRQLTMCNDVSIATINSGLPLKGEQKMVNFDSIKSERSLRVLIKRNLNKEIHPGTKPSVDFIYAILDNAYNTGLKYDVTDMANAIWEFAVHSTNHSEYCRKLVEKMKFKSDEPSKNKESSGKLVFFDVEVFPNLFLVNWKFPGKDSNVVRMINPKPSEIEELIKMRLVGFNCRRYDNHILYARLMGYTNEQLYQLSQKIISGVKDAFFGEAYNISYTDVYDFSSKKQSLKKFEAELEKARGSSISIKHKELNLPWDQPVPENLWEEVAEYCDNDVIATEAVFEERKDDFLARKILAKLAGLTVNDTTNTLTQAIILNGDKNVQDQFVYRDLSKPVRPCEETYFKYGKDRTYRIFDQNGDPTFETYKIGDPLPEGYSILPFFPGYTYDAGKSLYLGEEIGEGGRVYSEPGIYWDVWDGDVASMHPNSAIQENVFGKYTKNFAELVQTRLLIKHKEFDKAKKLLDGKLGEYLTDEKTAKGLSQALKIAINSVYGLTSARFINPLRDPKNVDNLVAKRGALFMTKLKEKVIEQGFPVVHIKTDSIKIPYANDYIKDFVIRFGKEYGYSFETEYDFDRFAIVNDAVYIAKVKDTGEWIATGTQFAVPYVYKTLFSKEPIEFSDMCEIKQVTKGDIYLDMNEDSSDENSMRFIGRVGLFCPIKEGCGGGTLYRVSEGKKYAVTGTKGYRWLESDTVKTLNKENDIDISYYRKLVDEAEETISKYGDFDKFCNGEKEKALMLTADDGHEYPLAVDKLPF